MPDDPELAPAWREIQAELRRVVGDSTYDIWLAPLEAGSLQPGSLVLRAPAATQSWVAKRFGRVVESCARSVLGPNLQVTIEGAGDAPARGRSAHPTDAAPATIAFNPRYTFDQFVIGDGNRLAHAASLAVAELPGQAYNPLFLHAAPGLGKTHLLHAIGNYAQAFGGGATVRYTTVEAFTNNFITALGAHSLDRFKHAYRDADILLIDDVQFLASKAKTEEEFFHTFNTIHETGRQLVLTCDRLPRQLVAVEERLRERFEAGLVTDIRPPDFATRVAILSKRAALDQIPTVDNAVLELIASRVTDNVRALEGALIRIVAYHSLTGKQIDLELAATVLDGIYPRPGDREVSVADIQTAVASFYELTTNELVSPSRAARIAWPRQLAMHLARELTGASLHDIGTAFGRRNHATVLHACKKVSDRVAVEDGATTDLAALRELITDKAS